MKKSYQDIFQKYFIHGVNIMMIILGCIGLMKNYYHSLFFPSDTLMSIVLLIFLGIGFYCLYLKYDQMPFKLFLKIFLGLFLVMLILSQNELHYFVTSLKEVIVNDYFLNISELVPDWMSVRNIFYQLIILWLGLPVVYLIVSALCSSHLALLKTIFMVTLFMFPLLIKHTLSSSESYCFIIFIGYQFLSSVILKNQRQHYVLKMIMVCFLCVMTSVASVYMEDNPLFQQKSTSFLAQLLDFSTDGQSNPLGIVTQTGMSSDIDGTLPTGNIRLNKNIALTVQAETPFSSYLRAYSLANYQDNEWHEVHEDYQDSQSLTTYSDFLRLNRSISLETVKVTSQHHYDFQFIPYYFNGFVDSDISYSLVYDSYVENTNRDMLIMKKMSDHLIKTVISFLEGMMMSMKNMFMKIIWMFLKNFMVS